MAQRIITAFLALLVFFIIFFANDVIFLFAIGAVILGALYEVLKATGTRKSLFVISVISGIVIYLAMIISPALILPSILAVMIAFMISGVHLYPFSSYKRIFSTCFLTIFVTLFLGTLALLRIEFGNAVLFLVFLFSWITDTGAYFSGYFFGKKKLIVRVSPKKTKEGAVGGVIVTLVVTLIYVYLIKTRFGISDFCEAGYIKLGILSIVCSILSQYGDLNASAIKRVCAVKDFGSLFPGHGGIMDRFDSVMFIAPVVYYFFAILELAKNLIY